MLAGDAIEREVIPVAGGGEHELAHPAAERRIDEHRRLRRIPVVRVVRRRLVVPLHLAGVDVDRDQRTREEVVAFAARLRGVGRRRVAGAGDVQMRLGIVRSGHPHLRAAVPGGVEVLPRLQPRIAFVHRHRVQLPLQLAGLRIERLEKSRRVEIVAGADQHVIADDDRRHRREVLLGEAGDDLVPALLAGARVERHEIVVRRLDEQIVAPHAHAAIADVGAALRLPEVVPDLAAVARVDRPRVVGRREIEDAVDREDRASDVRRAAGDDVAAAFAADDRRRAEARPWTAGRRRCTRPRGDPRHPGQREILHVRLVDLGERAVALARVVARIRRPRVGERPENLGRIESFAVALRLRRALRRRATTGARQHARATTSRDVFVIAASPGRP